MSQYVVGCTPMITTREKMALIYFRATGKQLPNFEGSKDNIGEQGT